jgi:hypothetical protein
MFPSSEELPDLDGLVLIWGKRIKDEEKYFALVKFHLNFFVGGRKLAEHILLRKGT